VKSSFWKMARVALVGGVLSLGIVPVVHSQTATDRNTTTTTAADDRGNRGNFGWIGILGLAGLAGLMKRDRASEGSYRTASSRT
jgi:hypothetical protein